MKNMDFEKGRAGKKGKRNKAFICDKSTSPYISVFFALSFARQLISRQKSIIWTKMYIETSAQI